MNNRKINLNGQTLTSSKATSFQLALDMARLNLETLPKDRILNGLAVAEHLGNLQDIVKFVEWGD